MDLGINEITYQAVKQRIQELINKPGSSFATSGINYSNSHLEKELKAAQQTILDLQQQLDNTSTPFGEDLATIKQVELQSLTELFANRLDYHTRQQIEQATNYQQVIAARNAFLQQQIDKKQEAIQMTPQEINTSHSKERIVLIGLLVVSLVSIGGLLAKMKRIKGKKIG